MNFKRNRVDDTMGFASVVVFALLAAGLQVSVSRWATCSTETASKHAPT